MTLTLLTRYGRMGASSRLRCHDLVPLLEAQGIACEVQSLLADDYLEALYAGNPYPRGKLATAYASRLRQLLTHPRDHLLFLQIEALPYIPFFLERLLLGGRPFLLDCDDAWFHRYDRHPNPLVRKLLGHKLDRLMARSACVLAGNQYVAERAERSGARRVEVLPTGLDCAAYERLPPPDRTPATIGWIGAPQNCAYLRPLVPLLKRLRSEAGMRLRVVSAEAPDLDGLDFDFEPWSEASEAEAIGRFDIGIMPLPDTPWERGKSGFKLVQYMAAARPSVASPVGENLKILAGNSCGLLASGPDEWKTALETLGPAPARRLEMGRAAQARSLQLYDRQVLARRLASVIRSLT